MLDVALIVDPLGELVDHGSADRFVVRNRGEHDLRILAGVTGEDGNAASLGVLEGGLPSW